MSVNSDQEELTNIISHDLQEPIRMISSYMMLLEKKYAGVLDDDAREYIKYAVNGANRLKLMLDDLLRYSGIKQENTRKTSFSLKEAIDTAVLILKKRYDGNNFEIIYDGDSFCEISADRNQIIQLFLNILDNAVKFNRNSVKKVHLTIQKSKGSLTFCVWDNGIGIDNEYHEKIFKIFKKLHNHSEYPGSGIGLAICRKILEIHNGKIWVESKPGNGTKFYFLLPYLKKKEI